MPRPVKFKVGDKINMLTILEKSHVRVVSEKKTITMWRCLCDCGKETEVDTYSITSGVTKSCGCLRKRPQAEDISGNRYGRLVAKEIVRTPDDKGKVRWLCVCDCGNEKIVRKNLLVTGSTKSCGCMVKESNNKIHGLSDTREYGIYKNMLRRCFVKTDAEYHNYGGRGITVCDRWMESSHQGLYNFLEDMGKCPEGMSLDRIDVSGNYCNENCRWATGSEQMYNQRKRKTNTSGRTGVSFYAKRGKWSAEICVNYVNIKLGLFSVFEDAVKAREKAEILYYGELKQEAFSGE